MDVDQCHTCKNHNGFPRNAATFDFLVNDKVSSLTANVNVTVHAASDTNTLKEKFEDCEDNSLINLTLMQVNKRLKEEINFSFLC